MIVFLLISLLSYFYSVYIVECNIHNNYSCITWYFEEMIPFAIYTPLFISASLLFTLFFSERVFNIWKIFAFISIPLMIIGIFSKGVYSPCGVLICTDRYFTIFFLGYLYLFISIIVVIISAIRNKRS